MNIVSEAIRTLWTSRYTPLLILFVSVFIVIDGQLLLELREMMVETLWEVLDKIVAPWLPWRLMNDDNVLRGTLKLWLNIMMPPIIGILVVAPIALCLECKERYRCHKLSTEKRLAPKRPDK